MTDTPNLALPYILPAQAQKHVTHNEAIRALDCIVQLSLESRVLTAPPGSPAEGSRYLVAAGATGGWAGQSGKIAAFQDGAWAFYTPQDGWIAWVEAESLAVVYASGTWTPLTTPGVTDHGMLTGLGDDDHPQYLTNARGDARYDAVGAASTGDAAHLAASDPHAQYHNNTRGDARYQQLDAELTALAALTSAANKLPYFTASGVAGLADLTSAGRALIDDADATAQRATLGLGSAATQNTTAFDASGAASAAVASHIADTDPHTQYHNNSRGDARYTPINPTTLGINATADTTNRLALSSAASLFNNAGNGHQIKVNKNAAADTASFLFQTGYSGRAEIGLIADDSFHFKVSPDGSTFVEALLLDKTTGAATVQALTAQKAVSLSPSNANVTLSPTGTGAVVINPATAGTIDNVAIGSSTASTVKATQIGINAAPDATNKLNVASAASLFNNIGNGHQVKVNKNAAGDTASFLFQTNFSGRAEIGTTGDDDFHFKVSPDGATFYEALKINKSTGDVTFPATGQVDVQRFTASGTWTKPAGAKLVRVVVTGGGGGGGGGGKAATLTAVSGGGGGGGAGRVDQIYDASTFGATETITVGAGGASGSGATMAGAGTNGGAGGNSAMGSVVTGYGGGGGSGGNASTASGGGAGGSMRGAGGNASAGSGGTVTNSVFGTAGGSGASSSTATTPTGGSGGSGCAATGTASGNANSAVAGAGGGGCGGGVTSGNAFQSGGQVINATGASNAGGATDGAAGTAGTSNGAIGGFGGSGGAGSVTSNGGSGGAGGPVGGGGGGGGGAQGGNGGAGGAGGRGEVLVITYR